MTLQSNKRSAPKILVRRFCALGDLVLTLPFLKALRQCHPESPIHWMGHSEHVRWLLSLGFIEEGFDEENSRWHRLYSNDAAAVRGLNPDPSGYDRIYAFVPDPNDSALLAGLKAAAEDSKITGIPAKPRECSGTHASTFFLSYLPEPVAEAVFHELISSIDKLNTEAAAVVHPGSGSTKKNWPARCFAETIERLSSHRPDLVFTVIQGPSDEGPVSEVVAGLPHMGDRLRIIHTEGIPELAETLARAKLYIGNDSGVTHLAGALNLPTVAVFGSSDPALWAPFGGRIRVVRSGETEIRFPPVDDVVKAALELLSQEKDRG